MGVVLVLVLSDEFVSLAVVGLSLSSPSELHLEALEVSFVLDDFNERLNTDSNKFSCAINRKESKEGLPWLGRGGMYSNLCDGAC